MDTSWVTSDRLSNTFEECVRDFLVFAQTNNLPDSDVIPCPCGVCKILVTTQLRWCSTIFFLMVFLLVIRSGLSMGKNTRILILPKLMKNGIILFDSDSFTYVTKEDFQVVFTLDELTGSIITSYMM